MEKRKQKSLAAVKFTLQACQWRVSIYRVERKNKENRRDSKWSNRKIKWRINEISIEGRGQPHSFCCGNINLKVGNHFSIGVCSIYSRPYQRLISRKEINWRLQTKGLISFETLIIWKFFLTMAWPGEKIKKVE